MISKVFDHAEWIMTEIKETELCDRYFEYRDVFIADPEKTTKLYISTHSQYAVYVNGIFVDCGQYDDYEDYQIYDTLDITRYLKSGENELYIGHYVGGRDFATRRKQIPGIIYEIHGEEKILAFSNCKTLSRVNTHFRKNQECITVQLGYNFEYDAEAEETEYHFSVLADKKKALHERPVKKLVISDFEAAAPVAQGIFLEKDASLSKAKRMQKAYLCACRLGECFKAEGTTLQGQTKLSWNIPAEENADGAYTVFDMKGETAGLLEFFLEVPDKTEVLISFGEHLDDLRVRSAVGGRNFCFRYVAKAGKNEFFYPYQRIGLRYLQFHVYGREGSLTAGIRKVKYPVVRQAYGGQDKLHRRIYDVACNTLELCMHEHYEDCPWREQALYAMDSRIQILCGYYAFREYDFPKANLQLMLKSLRSDGLLELCAPGKVPVNIPCFSAVFVREVLEYLEYTKDIVFVKQILPDLKKIVEGFADRRLENGLLPLYYGSQYWNFYEWRDGIDGSEKAKEGSIDCLLNAFVSDAFRCFAEICGKIGETELENQYLLYHVTMNKVLHQMFYDKKAGAYLSALSDPAPRHALTQGMMLFVDAVPEELKDQVTQSMIGDQLIPCSLSMSIYVYEAFLKQGEKYCDYVLGEIERIWGRMLFEGADTFWETDLGADDFGFAGSLCHGWSAVPLYLLCKYYEVNK